MIKLNCLIELAGISTASRRHGRKAVTIGRRAAGLVQNGMVTAGASETFLKSTGEILQSVREHIDADWLACQTRFFCAVFNLAGAIT
jgi:hypothetical protein